MESTATWTESWLYPSANGEQPFAHGYLDDLKTSLEHWVYKDPHQYGSYLLWYFAQHRAGLPNAVRDVWAASTNPDSLQAVNTALAGAGGLKDAWPKSALYNWNRPPFEDFTTLDGIYAAAHWDDTEVKVNGGSSTSYPVPTDVGHMQQRHLHYTIMDGVKSLTFINPFFGYNDPYAKVQALVNINGTWEPAPREWTASDREGFCLERPEEKVTELVLIITNSNYTDRSDVLNAGPGELVASPLGCKGWTGSAHAEIHYYDTTYTITVDNLRFEPSKDSPYKPGDRYEAFDLTATGTATWHASGTWPNGCASSGTMTLAAPGEPDGAAGDIVIDHEENLYYILGNGHVDGATFTVTCENGDSMEVLWPVISFIWNGGPTDTPFKEVNGQLIMDAEYTDIGTNPFFPGKWSWHLTPLE